MKKKEGLQSAISKPRVLFLSAWYPMPHDPMFGLFVQKHARVVASVCDVAVVYAYAAPEGSVSGVVIQQSVNGVNEFLISYPLARRGPLKGFVNFWRWIKANYKCFQIAKAQWGLPHLVHANILTRVGLMAYLLKIVYGIPYLISEHWSRYFTPHLAFRNRAHRWLTRFIIRKSETLTVVSDALGKAMVHAGLCKRYSLIPNVVETRLFKPGMRSNSSAKKQIIHISCFEEKSKNLSGILKAVKRLSDQRQDFTLQMVGEGHDLPYARQLAAELNIPESVLEFTGLLEGEMLAGKLADSDLSILLSNYETFGIVVYESLACGVPVVVSDVADFRNHIDPGKGIVCLEHTPEAFARAISNMLDTAQSFEPEPMRQFVIEYFSEEFVRHHILQMYQEVLKARK